MKLESRSTRPLLGAALAALTLSLAALTGTAAVVGQSSPGPLLSASAELLPGSRGLDRLRLSADQGECPTRHRVNTGYVDHFAARLRKLAPQIQVVNYGCPR